MDRLVIGEVLKPQGIRGEIKIKTFTDENTAVKSFKRVFIGGEEYRVLSFRAGESGFAYLGLRGVPDRNAAELLRDDAPPLEEGTYYIVDLLGCEVSDETGKVYGTLENVVSLASDVYTVKNGAEEISFPAVRGVVQKVDISAKKIVVNSEILAQICVKNA